jgi:glycosyltransferase involved in cell wall biosynthesis
MALVDRYALGKIFLLRGFVEDVGDFYRNLDIYLNTSLHEGIPMTILEAMSQEIPVIAPDVGGMKEIIDDGIDGYLVHGRDPKAFAEQCLRLYNDDNLRLAMGASAREKVEEDFSTERMAKEYHQLYLEVSQN